MTVVAGRGTAFVVVDLRIAGLEEVGFAGIHYWVAGGYFG